MLKAPTAQDIACSALKFPARKFCFEPILLVHIVLWFILHSSNSVENGLMLLSCNR
jgi:hypothetical protein